MSEIRKKFANIYGLKRVDNFDMRRLCKIKYASLMDPDWIIPDNDFVCDCGCWSEDYADVKCDPSLQVCLKKHTNIVLPADMKSFYTRYGAPPLLTLLKEYPATQPQSGCSLESEIRLDDDGDELVYMDKPSVYFMDRLYWSPWPMVMHCNAYENIKDAYPDDVKLNLYDWYEFIKDKASVDNGKGAFLINLNPESPQYGHVWAFSSSDEGFRCWIANSFTEFLEVLIKDADLFLHQERYPDILDGQTTGMVDFYNMTIDLNMYCPSEEWRKYAKKTGRKTSE